MAVTLDAHLCAGCHRTVVERGTEVKFASGSVLLQHGETTRHCYAIRAGSVLVTASSAKGRPWSSASCFFNPTHGQGMSAAAGQPVAAEWVRGPWILAAMSDFENPLYSGDFPEEDLPDLMQLSAAAERSHRPRRSTRVRR